MRTFLLAASAFLVIGASHAHAQNSRRDREDPEIVVETGGRMGACDDLQFTRDGKQLLAVGDDKVVRIWSYADGAIDPQSVRTLRWSTWREQHGAIYALSLSPDGKRAAIGGLGALTSAVAVLDLASGRITDMDNFQIANGVAVWAVAFSPSGERLAVGGGDGSVWLWDFQKKRCLGKHASSDRFNTVRLLRFTDENRLLSLAEDGELLAWDLKDTAKPTTVLSLKLAHIYRAAVSRDGRWLAAAPKDSLVALRSLDGDGKSIDLPLKQGEFARSLVFDPKGRRLAVAVGSLVPGASFLMEANDRIVFYDLDQSTPMPVAGPPHSYRAERLAFHPTDDRLAVAGGDNQEVTLWDPAQADKPVSILRGTGACLWDVALSKDGGAVGFRDQRDPDSTNPDARGLGPWRAFDLLRRQWLAPADFIPVRRLTTADDWTVEPDAKDPYVWWAVHTSGVRHKLPLDRDTDGMPRCYAFLDARGDGPTRLAVGHYWGLSVFELTKKEARRVRLCVGHQGEVTALGVSNDQSWLVSCSNDMTLSAWSLTKDQPLLGASFEPKGDGLEVKAVDYGSPAWEAGLVVKDEVRRFAFDPQFAGDWMAADPKAWLERLENPVPGKEHAFSVSRAGGKPFTLLTTLKQRPLWRFFPAGDDEWVLWMWRNSYYDSSTKGDYAVGWHVNARDLKTAPTFYRAERFRKFFRRPDVINRLLGTNDPAKALSLLGNNPVQLHFDGMEPPAADLKLVVSAPDKDIAATLSTYARGDNPDEVPVEAELWINDYRMPLPKADVREWAKDGESLAADAAIPTRSLEVAIPHDKLRAGGNIVTFQTWNILGGRTDATATVQVERPAPEAPRLIGVAVGINDYKAAAKAKNGERALGDLEQAINDANALTTAWNEQKLYGDKDMVSLVGPAATRQAILDALDALARKAEREPDDRCVIFLSGHGDFRVEPADHPGEAPKTVFIFCPPDYNPSKPETGITDETLFKKLAAIPCRKLLILDACRSGAAKKAVENPARGFAPDGQGPVVLAGCDLNQASLEDGTVFHHGLFTFAILEALGSHFGDAAHGGRLLDVNELFQYTRRRLPQLLKQIDQPETAQTPILFAPENENYPVAEGAAAPGK